MKKEKSQNNQIMGYSRWLNSDILKNEGIYCVHLNPIDKFGRLKYKERIVFEIVEDKVTHIKDTKPLAIGITGYFINPDEYSLLDQINNSSGKVIDRRELVNLFHDYLNHQWEIAQRLGRYGDLLIDFPGQAKIDESFIKEHIKIEEGYINKSELFYAKDYQCVDQEYKDLLRKYISDYFAWLIKQYNVQHYSVGFGIPLTDEQYSKLWHYLIEKKYIAKNITDWEFKAIFGNGYVFKRITWIKMQTRNKELLSHKSLVDLLELLGKKRDYNDRHKIEACIIDSGGEPLRLAYNAFFDNKTTKEHSEFYPELKEIVKDVRL